MRVANRGRAEGGKRKMETGGHNSAGGIHSGKRDCRAEAWHIAGTLRFFAYTSNFRRRCSSSTVQFPEQCHSPGSCLLETFFKRMKTSWVVLGLALMATQMRGQAADDGGYSVSERGPHHRVWQRVITVTNRLGETLRTTNRAYIELATGLNYQDSQGRWVESREEIEISPSGGAVARQGQHKAKFAGNLNSAGAIELQTPDGKVLRSHVLGLSYFDSATGKSVLIAEVKDSTGVLYPPNVIVYPDAFTDFKADVRYTYTKGGFEQDIILREKPPGPEEYGLDPATTRLQVLTEFLNPPQPGKLARALSERGGPAAMADTSPSP